MPITRLRSALVASALAFAALGMTGCTVTDAADAEVAAAPSAQKASEPSVTAVSPATGGLVGGETVTLKGEGLGKTASVKFGDQDATGVVVVSATEVQAVVPPALNFAVGEVPVTAVAADATVTTSAKGYSYAVVNPVDREMQYAFAYWQDYNLAEWGVFSDNDCGNFVNQAMVARGWQQTPDWFSDYATTGDFSLSWVRGNEMDAWYAANPDAKLLTIDQRDQVKIGDVVMFDWDPQNGNGVDHTMIVSGVKKVDGTTKISLVGHTVDAQYRDFDTAITVDNPGGTAHFYSIS